ncbi:MAG TPA: LacI family DNA-binding transcriptional regulator [Terracidiphilus sp.]|nr:LacI family DNA-binding transcriptional regulator [Terracidiphilus sp.]
MRDIAKIAGVSSATVSRVINGLNTVRPATAERVRRVIEEHKFIPNGSATTLKYGRSSTYGLIIPDITNPFFPEFIHAFEGLLADIDRNMLMATTASHPPRVQKTIHRMLVSQVDGIALLASEIETEPIEAMIKNRVPLVTMDRRVVGKGLSDIAVDNDTGMKEAIDHLVRLRHRKIGYIGGIAGPTISDHRLTSFIDAMQGHGLQIETQFLRIGDFRITGGEAAMTELLQLKKRPTAILTANDLTAIGALRVIHRCGLTVPGDFSIIGFDDIELSDIVYPPLTTIRLPRHEMAKRFVGALAALAQDPHGSGRQYKVETSLVIRSSTGLAKKSASTPPTAHRTSRTNGK